jgi:hypothetical protein
MPCHEKAGFGAKSDKHAMQTSFPSTKLFEIFCSDGIESYSCVWAVHDGEAPHTSSSAMHSCTECNSDFENHCMQEVHKLLALCASLPYDVTALPGASAIAGSFTGASDWQGV